MRIDVQDIAKRFGKNEVVGKTTFSIGEGELFTLLGPSGCGKTTLLRLIAGFYAPDEGEVRFEGRRVNEMPPHQRGIGMVFQNYALWPHMTVAQNVAYGLKLRNDREVAAKVEAVLAKVRLEGFGERYPGQISGGQQQRVALARALVLNPRILLLDEPLSNLDAKVRVQVRQEIRKLQKELGITTVYVTHDQEEALTLSDRIVVFNKARVFQLGTPRELYERPANPFVADFIGINNQVPGTVREANDGFLTVATALGDLRAMPNDGLKPGSACVVCVRPENVAFQAVAGHNVVRGKVSFAAYLGNTVRYDIDVGGGATFKADARDTWHGDMLALGAPVELAFGASAAVAVPAA